MWPWTTCRGQTSCWPTGEALLMVVLPCVCTERWLAGAVAHLLMGELKQ